MNYCSFSSFLCLTWTLELMRPSLIIVLFRWWWWFCDSRHLIQHHSLPFPSPPTRWYRRCTKIHTFPFPVALPRVFSTQIGLHWGCNGQEHLTDHPSSSICGHEWWLVNEKNMSCNVLCCCWPLQSSQRSRSRVSLQFFAYLWLCGISFIYLLSHIIAFAQQHLKGYGNLGCLIPFWSAIVWWCWYVTFTLSLCYTSQIT